MSFDRTTFCSNVFWFALFFDDDDLEALYANSGEEHVEIEETLNEEELELMFRQVENEFK